MSRAALILVLPMLFACAKKEAPAVDTTAAVTADTSAPAAPSYAGTWSVNVMPVGKDTVLTSYVLNATADQTGWKMTFPGRSPMDLKVLSVSGDSTVTETGPFESAITKGLMVNMVHSAMHLEGDKLVGTAIVHYARKTADSVVTLRQEGTRQ